MKRLNQIEIVYPPAASGAEELAERLHSELLSYRIPAEVRRKTGVSRVSGVEDPWLIVLCSPDTPRDASVLAAIDRFVDDGRYNHILTLLVSGTPEESFPDSIRFERKADGSIVEHEPLAANVSAGSIGESLRLLETEKLRILAPILNVSFDTLMNRQQRARNRIMAIAAVIVLAGAAAFLGYALNRRHAMRLQNEQLTGELLAADRARDEAQKERDAARKSLARKAGVQAAAVQESGDNEMAMLLCLEYLPEFADVPELTGTLENALSALCAKGYVPVTDRKAYVRDRNPVPEDAGAAGDPGAASGSAGEEAGEAETGAPPEEITVPVPRDREYRKAEENVYLRDYDKSLNLALYQGTLRPADGSPGELNFDCIWAGPPDAPEEGRFLTDERGIPLHVTCARILYDGTVYAAISDAGGTRGVRVDPGSGAFAGVFDGAEAEEHPLADEITFFWEGEMFDDLVYVPFGMGRGWGTHGFEDLLVGLGADGLEVYDRQPFRFRFAISDGHTKEIPTAPNGASFWTGFGAAKVPSGRRFIVIGMQYVYDGDTGEFLYEIDDLGQYIGDRSIKYSSEGYMAVLIGDSLCLWDLENASPFGMIPGVDYNYLIFGPEGGNGLRSARIVSTGSTDDYLFGLKASESGLIWEYRDGERPVPESLEGRIALAKELLGGRELTAAERRKYHVE